MDISSLLFGISIPLALNLMGKIVCKCRDWFSCECLSGLQALQIRSSPRFLNVRSLSFKNM